MVHLINGLESKYNLSLKFNDKVQMLCWKISYTVLYVWCTLHVVLVVVKY